MCPDLTSSPVQGTTLIETFSYNVHVTETLDMQKDPKAMLVKDWVIAQSEDPAIREIKYLLNNKDSKGERCVHRMHKSPNNI